MQTNQRTALCTRGTLLSSGAARGACATARGGMNVGGVTRDVARRAVDGADEERECEGENPRRPHHAAPASWSSGTPYLTPPPGGWLRGVCCSEEVRVPHAAVAVVDASGLLWQQVGSCNSREDAVAGAGAGDGGDSAAPADTATTDAAPTPALAPDAPDADAAVFEACSLSKVPFVLTLATLVLDGVLSFDEPVGAMLPEGELEAAVAAEHIAMVASLTVGAVQVGNKLNPVDPP